VWFAVDLVSLAKMANKDPFLPVGNREREGEMQPVLRRWNILIWAVVLLASVSGCLFFGDGKMEEGKPIDEAKVNQIIIGKTKRSDIYQLLGTPHSQFQGQVELKEGSLRGFFSHTENRYLSSLDDNHYAMLYQFTTLKVRIAGGFAIVVAFRNTEGTIKSDELLLLLEKGTDIVVDVAYRK